MEDSILKSTKKILGMDPGYTPFDLDVLTHINSVFSTLHDLGVGPVEGFAVEDDSATWTQFEPNVIQRNAIRTYVFLRVKLLFDPPQTSFNINAIQEQIKELEWRLSVRREGATWVPPVEPSSSPFLP